MDQFDEVVQAVQTLKGDLNNKLNEISTEITTLEGQIADPNQLAGLKQMVDELDTQVKSFQPPAPAPTPSPEPTSATPTQPVYTFTASEGVTPDARFTVSGFETVPAEGQTAQQLFYFSEDPANQTAEARGTSVPGYTQYTGATQQTSAPSA